MTSRFPIHLLAWSLLLGTFFHPVMAASATNAVFQGEGQAYVIGGNIAEARQLARETAQQQAIQTALETQVQGDVRAQRAIQLRAPELTSEAVKLLSATRIVDQQQKGRSLRVRVEIEVAPTDLQRFLAHKGVFTAKSVATKKAHLPSVMVVLSEDIDGRHNPEPFSLHRIISHLSQAGFRIVDENAMRNSIAHDRAVQDLLRGDSHTARAAALQFGAALVITGKATTQPSSMSGGGMQAYGANIVLRAYQADSAAILASSSADGSYPHINATTGQRKALESATDIAMDSLMKELKRYLQRAGDVVAVSISNVSFSQLSKLRQILKRDFPEIHATRQRGFAANVGHLDITVDDPQEFANKVVQHDFGSFHLDVLSYSPHKIDFKLIPVRN